MFYRFPQDLRKFSADPANLYGTLFPGTSNKAIPKAIEWIFKKKFSQPVTTVDDLSGIRPFIIAIGDIVSIALLNNSKVNKLLKYCFIDNKTQRESNLKLDIPKNFVHKKFRNPTGTISVDIFKFLQDSWDDENQYIVEIQGEEDLLVVPAVLETHNSFIFYGQPPISRFNPPIPSGCVVIQVTDEVKTHFKEILTKLERIDSN